MVESNMQGKMRQLTATEIGFVVRLWRGGLGIKRADLAERARVSEKTIERVESGEVVREHSYRRIAIALGLKSDVFVAPMYVPTPEEWVENRKQQENELRQTHWHVAVSEVTTTRQVLPLLRASGTFFDDRAVAEQDMELVASLKENLDDWSWIASEMGEVEALKGARQVLAEISAIASRGYSVRAGTCDKYRLPNGTLVSVGVLAFFRRQAGAAALETMWIPKQFVS